MTNEYVRLSQIEKIAFTGDSGPAHFEVTYLTEPVADGTKLTCQMQMEQRGLFGLMDSLIAGSLKRDFEANFRDLKVLLESQTRADLVVGRGERSCEAGSHLGIRLLR